MHIMRVVWNIAFHIKCLHVPRYAQILVFSCPGRWHVMCVEQLFLIPCSADGLLGISGTWCSSHIVPHSGSCGTRVPRTMGAFHRCIITHYMSMPHWVLSARALVCVEQSVPHLVFRVLCVEQDVPQQCSTNWALTLKQTLTQANPSLHKACWVRVERVVPRAPFHT